MKHVGDLLADLPLPRGEADLDGGLCGPDLLHDLGADLPAGHLHLWGGPPGAGKTSFLLSLLLGAALRGRRVVYASYHLPADTLALRMLAMIGSLDTEAVSKGHLDEAQTRRAVVARRCLRRLPVHVLEARGYSVPSIEDRLVRMPFRAEVVAVDYLQAVVRDPETDPGHTVRALSALASRLHVAFVVALQGEEASLEVTRLADRAGWLAPSGGSGLRRAEIIRNRYGERASVPLRFDRVSGALERVRPARPSAEEDGAPGSAAS